MLEKTESGYKAETIGDLAELVGGIGIGETAIVYYKGFPSKNIISFLLARSGYATEIRCPNQDNPNLLEITKLESRVWW